MTSKEIKHIHYKYPTPVAEFENKATYEIIFKAVRTYLPSGSVLDMCCGRGELMKLFSEKGYKVYGCDMDAECIKMRGAYGQVKKLTAEEFSLDIFDARFDCIILSHVLEHIENPRQFIVRLTSSYKGLIVISIPNPYYSLPFLKALLGMKINYVNKGHLYSWDWFHFKTFIEIGCNLEILNFYFDSVALPFQKESRSLLYRMGLLYSIENRLLRMLLPRFCRSITAVIRTKEQ